MVRLLTVDAAWDLPTTYISSWMDSLVAEARLIGTEVLKLQGSISETDLVTAIQSFQPEMVFLGGHGSPSVFTTADMVPLLIACTNDQVLANTRAYFISCLTGQQLVPSTVSKGTLGAAGFTTEFTWVVAPPYIPDQDPYAKPFERLIVEPAMELLKGNGYLAWYNRLQLVAREEQNSWLQSEDPLSAQVVLYLRQNASSATFVSATEELPGFDLSSVLPRLIGGYILKTLLSG